MNKTTNLSSAGGQTDFFNQSTWVGGPTHHVQRQHIPGYRGHVAGLKSEGLYAKPYAKLTAESLNNRIEGGFIINDKKRLQTSYENDFNFPQTRQTTLKTAGTEILQEAAFRQEIEQIKAQAQPKSIEDVPPIDRVPVIGYMGFRPVYRHPLKRVSTEEESTHPIETDPRLASTYNYSLEELENKLKRRPPIVGYTGFQSGIKAENMFGKSFKDITTDVIFSDLSK